VNIIWTEGIIALIAVFLFQFRNPQKKLLHVISLFIAAVFLSKILLYFGETFGQSVWLVSSIGLLLSYILRFRDKQSTGLLEYLKFIGLLVFIIYPLTSYYNYNLDYRAVFYLLSSITLPVLAILYLYDRWILKPEKMKTKFVVILVVQSVLIFLMLTFSLLQKSEADKQTGIAMDQRERAIEQYKLAEEFRAQLEHCNKK
jgi:hypothetical protein